MFVYHHAQVCLLFELLFNAPYVVEAPPQMEDDNFMELLNFYRDLTRKNSVAEGVQTTPPPPTTTAKPPLTPVSLSPFTAAPPPRSFQTSVSPFVTDVSTIATTTTTPPSISTTPQPMLVAIEKWVPPPLSELPWLVGAGGELAGDVDDASSNDVEEEYRATDVENRIDDVDEGEEKLANGDATTNGDVTTNDEDRTSSTADNTEISFALNSGEPTRLTLYGRTIDTSEFSTVNDVQEERSEERDYDDSWDDSELPEKYRALIVRRIPTLSNGHSMWMKSGRSKIDVATTSMTTTSSPNVRVKDCEYSKVCYARGFP